MSMSGHSVGLGLALVLCTSGFHRCGCVCISDDEQIFQISLNITQEKVRLVLILFHILFFDFADA